MRYLTLLLALPFPAFAEDVRNMTVSPGSETLIIQPQHWRADCKLRPIDLILTELPERGEAVIRRGKFEIGDFGPGELKGRPEGSTGEPPCLGVEVEGHQVFYRAGPDTGEDSLGLTLVLENGRALEVTYQFKIE